MSKTVKPKKKPTKTGKPVRKALTARQQLLKDLQGFEERVNQKMDSFRQVLNSVVEQQNKNIQLLNNGLEMAEAHVVMLRRAFDDALNDLVATQDVTAQRVEVKDGQQTLVDVPAKVVNWEHYTTWFVRERMKAKAAQQSAIEAAQKQAAEKVTAAQDVAAQEVVEHLNEVFTPEQEAAKAHLHGLDELQVGAADAMKAAADDEFNATLKDVMTANAFGLADPPSPRTVESEKFDQELAAGAQKSLDDDIFETLESAAEAKKGEPVAPPVDDGIPEGAAIFGGQD